jgi:GT2 family glycosyltransferase
MIDDQGHRDTCLQSIATVTVAYNGAELLRRQIAALLRQTRAIQEVVIVDNQSKDSTVQILAKEFPNVTILRMEENLGQAGRLAVEPLHGALHTQARQLA